MIRENAIRNVTMFSSWLFSLANGRDPVDLEDFVDDFVTFFIAGNITNTCEGLHSCACASNVHVLQLLVIVRSC